jgi:hypothetical protein
MDEDNIIICANCGEEPEESYHEHEGEHYCEDCFSNLFFYCERCQEYAPRDEMNTYNNDEYCCDSCLDNLYKCEDCEEYFTSYYMNHDNEYCDSCWENYNICSECDEVLSDDDTYWDDNNNAYCSDCYRDQSVIHDYSFKPYPEFHRSKNNILEQVFGVELEVDKGDNKTDCAKDLNNYSDNEDLFYLKNDGSLDDGFEIVTHPCSLNFFKTEFPWNDITRTCKDYDFQSHDAGTCGLHIHTNRDFFGKDDEEQEKNISKLLFLFNNLWNNMVTFSRRTNKQLSDWAKRYQEKDADNLLIEGKTSNRYMSINLQNSKTIEFRIFRGTLNVDTIIASIQLISLLSEIVKNNNIIDIQRMSYNSLAQLAHNNKYNEFIEYSLKKELL